MDVAAYLRTQTNDRAFFDCDSVQSRIFISVSVYICRAVVVVEGATVDACTEATIMLALGLILNTVGIGLFCWAIFMLAVYALPFFVGLGAGLTALHSGAGIIGALLAGFIAAALTVALARVAFAVAPSRIVHTIIGATFVVPAGIAGYHVVLGLSQFGVPSLLWREIFAFAGATLVAITTWTRISAFAEPHPIEPGRAIGNEPRPTFTGPRARHDPSPRRR